MKQFALFLACALFLLLPNSVAAAECQFVLGFATLRNLIGHEIVGECLENEHYEANGDSLQQTTGGLLVWRKADNWTAFTDGYRTWINGPNGLEQRLNTERFEWEVDQAIAALPWIDRLPWHAEYWRSLARASQPVFWILLERQGEQPIPFATPKHLTTIAQADEAAALEIVRMPFLATNTRGRDPDLLEYLAFVATSSPAGLRWIVSHPRLSGGIMDQHTATVALLTLEYLDSGAAAAMLALPWVQDGFVWPPANPRPYGYLDPTRYEDNMVMRLVDLAFDFRQLYMATINKPWMREPVDATRFALVSDLVGVSWRDKAISLSLIEMPFLESIGNSNAEAATLSNLRAFLKTDSAGAQWLMSLPRLADGITDEEAAVVALARLQWRNPSTAELIQSLPWIEDGIGLAELDGVLALQELALASGHVYQALASRPWIQDGISIDEQAAVSKLADLLENGDFRKGEEAVIRLISMPFLAAVDAADVGALNSLVRLNSGPGQAYVLDLLARPALHGGIRDDQVGIIAVLDFVYRGNPHLVQDLLHPTNVSVQKRVLRLPQGRETVLTVANATSETYRTLDLMAHLMRSQADFMSEATPRRYFAVLVAKTDDYRGPKLQPGIRLASPHAAEDTWSLSYVPALDYWLPSYGWVRYGATIFLQSVATDLLKSHLHASLEPLCSLAGSLSELERKMVEARARNTSTQPSRELEIGRQCEFDLGYKLFLDLYRSLGDEPFRQGFRKLYEMQRDGDYKESCYGEGFSGCVVKAAFIDDADPHHAAIADRIINRWYHGADRGPP